MEPQVLRALPIQLGKVLLHVERLLERRLGEVCLGSEVER